MKTIKTTKHLDRLLLDPNNYRFIDKPEYVYVSDEKLTDPRIQKRTLNFILDTKNANVTDLISSFTTNGFLDIDQIQVKEVGDKYIVLEGNRRVATLKYLYEEYKKGNDVGNLKESNFKSVPIVVIEGEDPSQHLITMGLQHIGGKKRWSPVNEAQLIEDLVCKYHKTESEICKSLGISTTALRKSRRTLSLIQHYKRSDYGDQFKSSMYSIFESVIRSPKMKSWIGWNDMDYKVENHENIERFYTWISTTEEIDWDREDGQKIIREPIITQYRQVKEVADFITDDAAITRMEKSRSIAEGYSVSTAVGEAKLREALNTMKSATQVVYSFNELIDGQSFEELNTITLNLSNLIPESKAQIFINEKKASRYFQKVATHFSEFTITKYRKLQALEVSNIGRVNIFAGGNNMGKTSFLEAFYLASQLNNIHSFLDLERYRGKFLSQFHSKWLEKNFMGSIELKGKFNDTPVELSYTKEETQEDIEKSAYLNTITSEAKIGEDILSSYIHLFANKKAELHYNKSNTLCQAAFTSPYRYNETLLHTAHRLAIENKYYEQVISFIQEHLDTSIEKIDLVNEEGENRFKVTSSTLNKAIDLTKYGEGLQRVFEIALLLGYCKDGILCIDELDSAIHKSLLIKVTEFIQRIAKEFNVQVFLSTHSKECIDAFVKNEYPDDELMAYALTEEENKVICRYLEGNKLARLVDSINIDIR